MAFMIMIRSAGLLSIRYDFRVGLKAVECQMVSALRAKLWDRLKSNRTYSQ
jgi:hypothetical protein